MLLEAARRARAEQTFIPVIEGPVALDVELRASVGRPSWDATNYLGGIGHVLEDKAHRGVLDHLDEFAGIWLFHNDRQIKEIAYREVESDQPSYTVTIRELGTRTSGRTCPSFLGHGKRPQAYLVCGSAPVQARDEGQRTASGRQGLRRQTLPPLAA